MGLFIMISFLVLGFVVSGVVCDPVSVCDPNIGRHFIADHVQCDRFHMCDEEGRLAAEFVCMDGLVFHPGSSQCALPFKAHCVEEGRTLLQEPKPEGNCQRQNGRWAIADTQTPLIVPAVPLKNCTGFLVLQHLEDTQLSLTAELSSLAAHSPTSTHG